MDPATGEIPLHDSGSSDEDAQSGKRPLPKKRPTNLQAGRNQLFNRCVAFLSSKREEVAHEVANAAAILDRYKSIEESTSRAVQVARTAAEKCVQGSKLCREAWLGTNPAAATPDTAAVGPAKSATEPAGAQAAKAAAVAEKEEEAEAVDPTAKTADTPAALCFDAVVASARREQTGMQAKGHFKSHAYMATFTEQIYECPDLESVVAASRKWRRMARAITAVMVTLKAAAKDLNKSMLLEAAAKEREAKKEAERKDVLALQTQKEALGARAACLRASTKSLGSRPIFLLDDRKLVQLTEAPCPAGGVPADVDFETPFFIKESHYIRSYLAQKEVTKMLTLLGSRYKKGPTFTTENKYTAPVGSKQGGEETEALFRNLTERHASKVLNLSKYHPTWNNTSWMYGYACTPNSATMFRLLCFGKIQLRAVQVDSFVQGLNKCGRPHDCADMKAVLAAFDNLDAQTLGHLDAVGVKVYSHVHDQDQMVVIPAGFVVAEAALEGPLLYGVRKSMFLQTPNFARAYTAAKLLLAKGGHDVKRMDEVLGLVAEAEAGDAEQIS